MPPERSASRKAAKSRKALRSSAGALERESQPGCEKPVFHQVYELVQRIPVGRVLTYGLISHKLNKRLSAQGVGWALNALPPAARPQGGKSGAAEAAFHSGNVPWHRVVNARGGLSTHKIADIPPDMQMQLLMAEGVVFKDELLDLERYLWMEGLHVPDSGRNS